MVHDTQDVNNMVWELVLEDEAAKIPGSNSIGGRWVLCNKSDLQQPKIRCRCAATEVHTGDGLAYYADTPPPEAKRLLSSKYAQVRNTTSTQLQLSCCDVTKACFNEEPSRNLDPNEIGLGSNIVCKTLRWC